MLTFPALWEAYLEYLRDKPSYAVTRRYARQWIDKLTDVPTRKEILARMQAVCPGGHFSQNATKANKELGYIRAACNWGTYKELWTGGNPTDGIRKFKTPRRQRIGRQEELRIILHALDFVHDETEIRDRAMIGLQIFTGCRPSESRTVQREHITLYGAMGCWHKAKTKNGEQQYLPIPSQVMRWLQAVPTVPGSPFYFTFDGMRPIHESTYRNAWTGFAHGLQIHGLWAYDLRRTLATYCRRVLKHDDSIIQAILNHYDGRALAHYVHADFDELAKVIQEYADWLWSLKQPVHTDSQTTPITSTNRRRGDGAHPGVTL